MDRKDLVDLSADKLAGLVLYMGHIVRRLDEDNEYLEFWTQDGEYLNSPEVINYIDTNTKGDSK